MGRAGGIWNSNTVLGERTFTPLQRLDDKVSRTQPTYKSPANTRMAGEEYENHDLDIPSFRDFPCIVLRAGADRNPTFKLSDRQIPLALAD